MKNFKKLLALLLAAVMIFAIGATAAFAEGDGETPTDPEDGEPATTKITINDDDEDATYAGYLLMTSTDDGDGHYAYVVNSKYSDTLQTLLEVKDDKAVIDAIAEMDDDEIREFADDLYAAISTITPDATFASQTATEVAQGYWLINETTVTSGATDKATSQVILDTKGTANLTVTPKKDIPLVEKEADKETACVGEEVEFTLTGTTANYSSSYDTYKYIFHDTLTNLDFVAGSVVVTIDEGTVSLSDENTKDDYTVNYSNGELTITFADLKDVVTKDSEIVVTYKATVNASAITTGEAENEVYVEYSNNPYSSGTGNTTEVEVTVYVINLILDKYDGASTSTKLANAVFTLMNANGKYYSWDDTNKKVVWSDTQATFPTDTNGAINFNGLAVGTYTLTEITPPDGYNALSDPIVVEVTASDDEESGRTYTAENASFTAHNGTVSVANNTGIELPSTGGTGTVIFITVGAVLLIAAGIVLTAKKRMYNAG